MSDEQKWPSFRKHGDVYRERIIGGKRKTYQQIPPGLIQELDQIVTKLREQFREMEVDPDPGTVAALVYFLTEEAELGVEEGRYERKTAGRLQCLLAAIAELIFEGSETV